MQRETGFHPLDADYTEGRGIAIATAEANARAQLAYARHKVRLKHDDRNDGLTVNKVGE